MPAPNPLLSKPLAAADASTLRAFERRLRSAKKSDKTVQSYLEAARLLAGWLGGRVALEEVRPADIEDFMIFLLGAHAASTAAVRFKSLQQFYGWLTAEEWIETDPMARLRPPQPTEKPVPVLSDDALKALIAACAGKEFADRRDEAIVRMFVDTGMRVSEMCGIRLDDLDMKADQVTVRGRATGCASCPSGRTPAPRSSATCGCGPGTSWPGWPGSGRAVVGAR
jgi:integrase/recombinase XerC